MAINNTGFPFKFWCAKVLPLVYDDSLSYYEFLCKLNQVIQGIADHDVEQDKAIQKNADDIAEEVTTRSEEITAEANARIDADDELERTINSVASDVTIEHNYIVNVARKFGALPYDDTTAYNVGDFCIYLEGSSEFDTTIINGDIYRCKATTIGSFDSTKWEQVNLVQFIEIIWSKMLEPFADEYDEEHTWEVDNIVRYGGNEIYGNNGGLPTIYRCINQTTGTFNLEDWTPLRFSWILDKINSSSTDLSPLFDIIAHTFNENDSYTRGRVVKKLDEYNQWKLYECNDDYVTGSWDDSKWTEFYPTNIEISGMQLYNLTVENQQISTENTTAINQLNTFFNSCIPMFLDKTDNPSYPTQNFPKFSLCRTTESPAPYAHVYYCTSDTDNTSFDSAVWVEIGNLQEWISAQISSINRYSEVYSEIITNEIGEV